MMNKSELNDLIPKDKFDIKRAENLNNYDIEDLRPILNDLLYCLADINWPIAEPVSNYLLKYTDKITDEIVAVLKTDDEVWKYWLIKVFGEKTTDEKLKQEIIRLATDPNESEKRDEIDIISQDIIEMRNW